MDVVAGVVVWDRDQVRLHPVADASAVLEAAAEASGGPLHLHSELDIDVYRLRRTDAEPDLVARAFGPGVDRTGLDTAASVLTSLAGTRFPAERTAGTPVLPFGEGRHLLLTEYEKTSPAPRPGFVLAWCAALLGRLATRSGDAVPAGGGWHRLGATPAREIEAALRLGEHAGSPVAEVQDALADADDAAGLPEALIHADLTPPNAVPQGDRPPVIIDWLGVGRGPRVWPLAFLLFAAGPRLAQRTLERYSRSITLSPEELDRLPGIMITRPLTLDLWSVAYERITPQHAISRCRAHRARVEAVTAALTNHRPPAS